MFGQSFEKSRVVSKHHDFGPSIRKSRFWSKYMKNLDWCQNFRNMSILAKIQKKMAILVKIFENLDFGEYFLNTSILVKIFENIDCGQNFRKIPILVKIVVDIDFGNFSQKERFCSKFADIKTFFIIFEKPRFYSQHLNFGPNIRKFRFWSKFLKNFGESQNFWNTCISILAKI